MNTQRFDELVCPLCHHRLTAAKERGVVTALRCVACAETFQVKGGKVPFFMSDSGLREWQSRGGDVKQGYLSRATRALPGRLRRGARAAAARLVWRRILNLLRKKTNNWNWNDADAKLRSIVEIYRTPGLDPSVLFPRVLQSWHWWNRKIPRPSLEIGGGIGDYTAIHFGGKQRIDYCSEFFGHHLLEGDGIHPKANLIFDTVFSSKAYELPLSDSSLATVLSMHTLHHIPELKETMAEVARALKKKGQFYATVETCHAYMQLPDILLAQKIPLWGDAYTQWRLTRPNPNSNILTGYVSKGGPYAQGMCRFSLDYWKSLAREVGLELIEVRPYAHTFITGILRDSRQQRLYCPRDLVEAVNDEVQKLCWREISEGISFENAHCVFLGFEKS